MFHNVLVCVDGSVHAERALEEAVDIVTASHGRLTLLTAIPQPPCWAATPMTIAPVQELATDLEKEARAALEQAVARVPEAIPVTTVLSPKPIREALKARLKCGEHDLLVMGSRGRGAVTSSVLGSVSHYALNHLSVPVLIVHSPAEQEQRLGETSRAQTGDRVPSAPGADAAAVA